MLIYFVSSINDLFSIAILNKQMLIQVFMAPMFQPPPGLPWRFPWWSATEQARAHRDCDPHVGASMMITMDCHNNV